MTAPALTYDELEPGQGFPPSSFTITAAEARAFAGSFRFDPPLPRDDAAPRALNPTLVGSFIPMRRAFDWGQGVVHAKEKLVVHAEALVGQPLQATVSIADKYEKKGRRYADVRLSVVDAATQAPVLDVLRSLVWPD